jgi:hypothetical protein
MYEALWSLSCGSMWSLTSACVERAGGAEKFRPPAKKYFFDSIDPQQTSALLFPNHFVVLDQGAKLERACTPQ